MNDPLVALLTLLGLFLLALSGIPTIHGATHGVARVLAAVAFGVATVFVVVAMTHA